MHYATIKWADIANGEGVRISLFVSGCTHHCKNCFNQIAWDFDYGELFTPEVEEKIFQELSSPFIAGISLLGGEPLEPQNQEVLYPFLCRLKNKYPQKTIWCYTGCVLDEGNGCLRNANKNIAITARLISLFDVLVDGPFVEEKKDIRLKFRGSSNQRVIDVKKTLERKECVLYLE